MMSVCRVPDKQPLTWCVVALRQDGQGLVDRRMHRAMASSCCSCAVQTRCRALPNAPLLDALARYDAHAKRPHGGWETTWASKVRRDCRP